MPFVRFSRDKRGYEHVYLVDTPSGRGQRTSARVLYWFRTPPGVKVGREPFDSSVRQALESTYPGLSFDWETIVSTPMPPPEVDWRERRRAQREAKRARLTEEAGEASEDALSGDPPEEAGPVFEAQEAAETESGAHGLTEAGAGTVDVAIATRPETGGGPRGETDTLARGRRRRRRSRRRPADHSGGPEAAAEDTDAVAADPDGSADVE